MNDPELGRLLAKVDSQIFSLYFLEKEGWLVAGNMYGGLHWIDLAALEASKNIAHHQKGVFAIERVGDALLTAGGGGTLIRWNIAEQRAVESLRLSNQSLRCIAYSLKRNELAIGASDHHIYLLDAADLTIKRTIQKAHNNSVFSIRYSADDQYLISGGRDAHLKIWSINNSFELISARPAHWYTINDVALHPKGHIFATASRDKTIKIWDAITFELLKVIETIRDQGHLNSVNCLYWSSHHDWLVSCSDDRSILIWEIKD